MDNVKEKIKITPIEEIFNPSELEQLMKFVKPEVHQCHRNSFLLAMYPVRKNTTIEYNEGIILRTTAHAFNSMVVDGERLYFDITDYNNSLKYGVERGKEALLLRRYSPKEILDKVSKDGEYKVTIESDGTLTRVLEEMAEASTEG